MASGRVFNVARMAASRSNSNAMQALGEGGSGFGGCELMQEALAVRVFLMDEGGVSWLHAPEAKSV